jgi:hypothetical protein
MAIQIPKNELNEFSLPRVCCATGATGPVTFQKVQFQFIPKWIAIFAIAPLLYLIMFFVLRKSASGMLPFSDEAWQQVRAARRNVAISVLALIGLPILGGMLASKGGDAGVLILIVGALGALIAVVVTSMRVRKVFPYSTLIDDSWVTLKLPSSEAERAFQQHLSAGRAAG